MTGMIDLNPSYLAIVERILAEHVPECEVRAFGSRTSWTAKDYSDLDLAVVGHGPLGWRTLGLLKEAFEESDLPMRVDVLDWHDIPDSFQRAIERGYVVLHTDAERMIPTEWQEVTLGALCDFRAGSVFKMEYQGESEGDYPFIKVSDMNIPGNRFSINEAHNWVSQSVANALGAKPFPVGTVVFAKVGEALKHNRLRILTQPTIIDNNMMGAIPKNGTVDSRFLLYAMSKFDLGQISSGTALPYLTVHSLAQLRILLPPLPEQRVIAHVLGTLDEKIELNHRMNETLEDATRALFRSWFVDFGPVRAKMEGRWRSCESLPGLPADLYDLFPDHLVSSELGEIPEGWEIGCYGQLLSHRTEKVTDRDAVVLSAVSDGELVRSDDFFMKRVYSARVSNYLAVEEWDIAYNPSRINIGSIGMLKEPILGAVSPVYIVARPRPEYRWFIEFHLGMLSTKQWINVLASGSVRQSLSFSDFASIPCVIPDGRVLQVFDERWMLWRRSILRRVTESETLAALRDALLPKLVSGDVRVA